jgi:5'-3' exonuclease
MGIPGLYGRWLSKEVIEAIFQGLPVFVASASFDMNGVAHDARKTALGEGVTDPRILQAIANTDPGQIELEINNEIEAILLRMIRAINPRDCVIFAFDGVAPGAKLQQQKGRREKAAKEKSPIESFDKNAITPGTEFMMHLDNFMLRFIGKHRNELPPKVIYSSHLVPGEGEHKIMDYYRSGQASDGPAAKQGASHVLYGLDADLIMLSLLAPIDNIFLSRESVKETVSIDKIKDYLTTRAKRPSAIDDFVVMMYLLGNDFLPHMPALEEMAESISGILQIYQDGDYVLTQTDADGRHEINWDQMKRFVEAVAGRENEWLAALTTKHVTYPSRFLQAALREGQFYPNVFRSVWYQNALGPKGPQDFTNTLQQLIGFPISQVRPENIEDMSVAYMRTMSWTYLYYREGTDAIDHDWAYPYYHTPMLADLAAVMQRVGPEYPITGFEAYEGMIQFTALHQLVAVLPLKSRDLIPLELQQLFSYNSIIRDLLPDNFIVELDGKTETKPGQAQGVPIIPMIDRERILEAVAQIVFTPERAMLWLSAEEQIFIRTPEEAELLATYQFDKQRQADFIARQATRAERGRGRGRGREAPTTARTGAAFVPTTTPGRGAPRSPGRGRGRGRGERGRGERGGRGGRGGGRETGETVVQRPPPARGGQEVVQRPPPTAAIQRQPPARGGEEVIQRPPPQRVTPLPQAPQRVTPLPQAVPQRVPPTLIQRPQGPVLTGATPLTMVGRRAAPRAPQQQVEVIPVAPVPQVPQQGPRSPAQWKGLSPLM